MGNRSIYARESVLAAWRDVFELLQLAETDIRELLHTFKSYPINSSTLTISVATLQEYLCRSKSNFPVVVLGMMDCGRSGTINFGEFVCSLWMFCTSSTENLAQFIFEVYDTRRASKLDDRQISELLFDLHGADIKQDEDLLAMYKQMTSMEQTPIKYEKFAAYCTKNSRLLLPLHVLQQHLRQNVMGHIFWERMTLARSKLTGVIAVSKLRLMLIRSRHELSKPSLSTKFIRAASAKVSKALSSLSQRQIYPEDKQDSVTSTTWVSMST